MYFNNDRKNRELNNLYKEREKTEAELIELREKVSKPLIILIE
jgi:hypothetical protein